ncbi:MAG TPA: protein kinase [Actinophytocola sp.]|uniref:serine/threonine-protein kinase n=1 Tax=Actinophytocola sp. TaxID=1872138 RepID=UPI002DDD249E|nr:protein kinase [Actinophytocola sp.]HEV2778057.1 protein kinase [Actinophytocola sp.]
MTDQDAELLAWAPRSAEQGVQAQPEDMRLAGYSDFRLIAEGGEGLVYRARQDGLDRYVAIKVINVGDLDRLARFRRELEITVRLGRQHPHIVTVIDTGTAPGGRPCIVMEYYDLGSLHDRLRDRGPLPVVEVVAAGTAVADALAFAHAQGFLHRDVKPQNILVLPTSYVLADFGIARMADAGHTSSLQMVSYRHAAPQMIDGRSPSPADDLWSLGSTLFTLLDGAPPFASENPDEDTVLSYLDRVRSAEPRPIRRADVPPELAAVISRCLSKRREDRFPDAAALRSALAAVPTEAVGWTPSMPIADFGPRPTPPPEPEARPVGSEVDPERTTLGPGSDLAGLTVRLPDDPTALPDFGPQPDLGAQPDFGPMPADYQAPAPWRPDTTVSLAPTPPAPPRRRVRRVLLFAVTAILVGGAIGVLATVVSGLSRQARQPPPPSSTAAPPSTSEQATTTVPAGGNPAFTPTLNRLEDQGNAITLIWSDPSGGKAQFVVVDVTGPRRVALATVVPGVTTYTVDGLDPAAEEYCFQVLAIGLNDQANERGASDRTCAVR